MKYVIDDTPIIEAEVMTLPKPEVSHEVLLPIIDRQIDPNSIIIPAPTLISKGTSSIEVKQTFQCDVDYYGGVGIEQDGAVDAKLVKNPNTMTATLTGLTRDTEYTIKGVGLPILGNETIGEGLVVRTKASPIPDEYQLIEYLEGTGTQYINTSIRQNNIGKWNLSMCVMETPSQNTGCGARNGVFATIGCLSTGHLYCHWGANAQEVSSIINDVNFHTISLDVINGYYTIDGSHITSLATNGRTTLPIYLFLQNGAIIRAFHSKIAKSELFDFGTNLIQELYPVYRKSDSKPGMYDIVNHQFYTNQGSGEFIVGPDKEWEE